MIQAKRESQSHAWIDFKHAFQLEDSYTSLYVSKIGFHISPFKTFLISMEKDVLAGSLQIPC